MKKIILGVLLFSLLGCASTWRVDELEKQVVALEKQQASEKQKGDFSWKGEKGFIWHGGNFSWQ